MHTTAHGAHRTMSQSTESIWGGLFSHLYINAPVSYSFFILHLDPKIHIDNYWTLPLAVLHTMSNLHMMPILNPYRNY